MELKYFNDAVKLLITKLDYISRHIILEYVCLLTNVMFR